MTDLRTIRGGTIPIARVRVVREAAEFIDLYFQDNVPSWRSPDIWVDWPGDNGDPNVPRTYPEGTPTDQGETVRFPSSGVEPHFLVVRPHNAGNVRAEDVKVRWFICDPPGAGDDGRWVQRDTKTMPQLEGGNWDIVPFTWNVDSSTNAHQCIRAEIIDWTIPTGRGSGHRRHARVRLRRRAPPEQQRAEERLRLRGGHMSYDPIDFPFQVHNDAKVIERAYLCPEGLPYGATLEVTPRQAAIPPGEAAIFHCRLTLDEDIIRPGCTNDQGFRLTAWRIAEDADERWGSCFYFVRPRVRTKVRIVRASWYESQLSVYGVLSLDHRPERAAGGAVAAAGAIAAGDCRRQWVGKQWTTVPVQAGGAFVLTRADFKGLDPSELRIQAWFDRTDLLASSRSDVFTVKHGVAPVIR